MPHIVKPTDGARRSKVREVKVMGDMMMMNLAEAKTGATIFSDKQIAMKSRNVN